MKRRWVLRTWFGMASYKATWDGYLDQKGFDPDVFGGELQEKTKCLVWGTAT